MIRAEVDGWMDGWDARQVPAFLVFLTCFWPVSDLFSIGASLNVLLTWKHLRGIRAAMSIIGMVLVSKVVVVVVVVVVLVVLVLVLVLVVVVVVVVVVLVLVVVVVLVLVLVVVVAVVVVVVVTRTSSSF